MKISVLCLPLAFCFSLAHAVGLDGNLAITTASGRLQQIRNLRIGDEVVCYSKDLLQQTSAIKGICEITVDSTVAITTADDITLTVSPTERFFLPKENEWVYAKNLKEGDCLLNEDMDTIAITHIELQDGTQQLFVITVDKHHNFLVSEGKYLVHNGPILGAILYCTTKAVAYGVVLGAAAGSVAATGGSALALAGVGEVLGATGALATGTGIVSTAVATSATATAAATTASGAVAATGAAAVFATVESWALYLWAAGSAVPWL